MTILQKYNLILIEDCAQSPGAYFNNKRLGSYGLLSTHSFYPGKNLGAFGDGGAICTSNYDLSNKLRKMRNNGSIEKYVHEMYGRNSRLDTLQAIILDIKLKNLYNWTLKRQELAKIYDAFFDSIGIQRPNSMGIFHSYHIYAIRVPNRDEIAKELNNRGVDTGIHYPHSLASMDPWRKYFRVSQDPTVSKELSKSFLSLPIHESLLTEEVNYISDTFRQIFN